MTIQRFDADREGEMYDCADGDYVTYADHLAAMQRERECYDEAIRLLREIASYEPLSDSDDGFVNTWSEIEAFLAALAAAKERSAPEVCEDTLEEKIADHQRDMDEEVWGGDL